MCTYVLDFQEIDRSRIGLVGGKAANLGELSRIDGLFVPAGFCVTTDAFKRIMADVTSIDGWVEQLSRLQVDDHEGIRPLSAEIREAVVRVGIPNDLAAAITRPLSRLGEQSAYAVRSSATAEDLPTASVAGQQDTYLNVVGPAAILEYVSRCWASLFTDRAVTYRMGNGVDHRKVYMAVVVQRMVFPQVAGVLFTADPIAGNRKVASVEATFGLAEALVSGLVNADVYTVRDNTVVAKTISAKRLSIGPAARGGTQTHAIAPERQRQPALTDDQVVKLVQLGRRIEAHFGAPQDIEWCLVDDDFHFVQSRPITTLFPIPASSDEANHVYISVGHQQMMTDAMTPLGVSFRQLTAARPFYEAGGRVFVDVSGALATAAGREGLLTMVGKSDPLIGDALETIIERGFIPSLPDHAQTGPPPGGNPAPITANPAIVAELINRSKMSIGTLKQEIKHKSGTALLDFIRADFQELKRILFDPQGHQVFMSAMEATWWLNDHLQEWLGETNASDTLTQSVPNNITSEMGLALLDVADVMRPYPDVVKLLEHVEGDDFLKELPKLAGGGQARDAIQGWLDTYGMRCVGEIDITRPRWSECPSTLVPLILGNVKTFAPGEAKRRFERGREEARKKEQELRERVRALPDGAQKADEVKRMIDRLRTFIGYREYPKYGMVSRYLVYKQALMEEAERLAQKRVIREREDIFYLSFQELQDVVRTNRVDQFLIAERKAAFRSYQALTPPRVLTSEGETISGAYRRDDVPADALVGLPVSAGTVEGRARVILDMAKADLDDGDILVTAFTDPSWTPLFLAIKGLVAEVGGQMTHGAVIAREYGLPAVVSVEHATRLIRDGQRIRVHGTEGYVELLP